VRKQGLAAAFLLLSAYLLAPLAEASLPRTSTPATEASVPAFVLPDPGRERSGFSLLEGDVQSGPTASAGERVPPVGGLRAPETAPLSPADFEYDSGPKSFRRYDPAGVLRGDGRFCENGVLSEYDAVGTSRHRLGPVVLAANAVALTAGPGTFRAGLGLCGLPFRSASRLGFLRGYAYDPRNASWLSEDPLGPVDSPNLYGYVGLRPHEKTDPLGLETFEELGVTLQAWKGSRGERFLVERLRKEGWTVFWGGKSHGVFTGGPDAFAYNRKTKALAFFDDKNWLRGSVSRASALENLETTGQKYLDKATDLIQRSNMPNELKKDVLRRIQRGNYAKLVTSAAPEGLVRSVSTRLEEEAIHFYKLEKRGIRTALKEAAQGAKALGKKAPIVKILVGAAIIATAEDKAEGIEAIMDPTGFLGAHGQWVDEEQKRMMYEEMYLPELVGPHPEGPAKLVPSHGSPPVKPDDVTPAPSH
jgi:RHS repeat-associated protein